MIKSSIENFAEDVGFDIGNSDDVTQAKLLNGFSRGIVNSMSSNDLNAQTCYIVDKLDCNSVKIIKLLYDFITYKESEK